MTAPTQENIQSPVDNKELNFRRMEAQYQKRIEETERRALEAERRAQELAKRQEPEDDDSSDEPYVDQKRLEKKLEKFGRKNKEEVQSEIQRAVAMAKEEAKREAFLEQNPDFYQTIERHAEKFGQNKQKLAKTILAMPDTFERQVLVYQTMKELGMDKPEVKEPTIQDKIDSNRRGQFYQPTNMGTSPYGGASGDFSDSGKKQAYDEMKKLQSRLRM